jgi:hypothetical protein
MQLVAVVVHNRQGRLITQVTDPDGNGSTETAAVPPPLLEDTLKFRRSLSMLKRVPVSKPYLKVPPPDDPYLGGEMPESSGA